VFKSFCKGTYQEPQQFSKENTWRSVNDYCEVLGRLDSKRWDRVLNALELSHEPGNNLVGFDDDDLETLSTYRGDLGAFTSPAKASGSRMRL
jgi:hypothetical protein